MVDWQKVFMIPPKRPAHAATLSVVLTVNGLHEKVSFLQLEVFTIGSIGDATSAATTAFNFHLTIPIGKTIGL